jgi:hypothetical protein
VFRAVAARGDRVEKCILQDTERLLLWSRHFAIRSPLAAAAARNTFSRQLETNFESFLTIIENRVIVGSLVSPL